jgi:hypothetical protein
MANLYVKKGATLQLIIAAANDDGSPVDLTTITTTSEVRTREGRLIDTLTLTPTSGIAGQYTVAQATTKWPHGELVCDFKMIQNSSSIVLKSQTVTIEVLPAVTT